MNYEDIINKLIERVTSLEERVASLESKKNINQNNVMKPSITTQDVKDLILSKIETAKANGEQSIILLANDLHRELGLTSRMPMVCSAMNQIAKQYFSKYLFVTESKQSSTLKIEYFF